MTSDDKPYREWTLSGTKYHGTVVMDGPELKFTDEIHVIEHKAFEEMRRERDYLKECEMALGGAAADNSNLRTEIDALKAELVRLQSYHGEPTNHARLLATRERYRAALEQICKIADEAIALFEHGGWYDYEDQIECGKNLRNDFEIARKALSDGTVPGAPSKLDELTEALKISANETEKWKQKYFDEVERKEK